MKRLLALILCLILCLSLFACNASEEPTETQNDQVAPSLYQPMALVEDTGVESIKIVGPGDQNRMDWKILGYTHSSLSPDTYTIEYYAPADAQYIDAVIRYINGQDLYAVDKTPIQNGSSVIFTFRYNNGEEVSLRTLKNYIGVYNDDNSQYSWYEMPENTDKLPEDFFASIDRPERDVDNEGTQSAEPTTKISVPIVNEKVKFPDKTLSKVFVRHGVLSGTTEITFYELSDISNIRTAIEGTEIGEPLEVKPEAAGGITRSVYFYFSDGTYFVIQMVPNCNLHINDDYYHIGQELEESILATLFYSE